MAALAATFRAIVDLSPSPMLAIGLFLVLLALVAAVFVWVVTVSVGALIASADRIRKGGEPDFGEGVKAGAAGFWRLLGINLLAKFLTGAAILFTGVNLFTLLTEGTIGDGFYYVFSFMVFLAISVAVSIVAVFASMYGLLGNEPFGRAVSRGYRLFVDHWLVSLEMAVLILAVNLVIGLASVLVLAVLAVPAIFLFMLASVAQSTALLVTVATLFAALLFAAIVIYGSFMTAFQISGWTRLWSEMNEGKPRSKLQRVADWLMPPKK